MDHSMNQTSDQTSHQSSQKIAMVFPGQGSQAKGMLSEWEQDSIVRDTFAEAGDSLGYDLWQLIQTGPETELNQTEITQPALLASGVALYRVWKARKSETPVLFAGHSLGEYTALVCANALSLSEGVKLVQERGQRMQAAVSNMPTAMAAIIGLEATQVFEVCAQTRKELSDAGHAESVVESANINAKLQIVIAGHELAVLAAMEKAKALGAKRALRLAVSVPSHTSLMKTAAQGLSETLEHISLRQPEIPVLHNVDVSIHTSVEGIRHALVNQLFNPVRWVDTIEKMVQMGIQTIVECGPGTVLTGLNKRSAPELNCVAVSERVVLCP